MSTPATLTSESIAAEPVDFEQPFASSTKGVEPEAINFFAQYSELLGIVREKLSNLDTVQIWKITKLIGISAGAIIALIMVKGILDTINVLPLIPGLLELLGVVALGQWCWQNLTTSEKRNALSSKIQNLRQLNTTPKA